MEPNTALAGAIAEISFAIFKASMVTFNEERTPSRPFDRLGFASMVEARGDCEKRCGTKAVRKNPSPAKDGRPFCRG